MKPKNELELRALAGRAAVKVSNEVNNRGQRMSSDEMIVALLAARYALQMAFPEIKLSEREYPTGAVQAEVDRQEAAEKLQ